MCREILVWEKLFAPADEASENVLPAAPFESIPNHFHHAWSPISGLFWGIRPAATGANPWGTKPEHLLSTSHPSEPPSSRPPTSSAITPWTQKQNTPLHTKDSNLHTHTCSVSTPFMCFQKAQERRDAVFGKWARVCFGSEVRVSVYGGGWGGTAYVSHPLINFRRKLKQISKRDRRTYQIPKIFCGTF